MSARGPPTPILVPRATPSRLRRPTDHSLDAVAAPPGLKGPPLLALLVEARLTWQLDMHVHELVERITARSQAPSRVSHQDARRLGPSSASSRSAVAPGGSMSARRCPPNVRSAGSVLRDRSPPRSSSYEHEASARDSTSQSLPQLVEMISPSRWSRDAVHRRLWTHPSQVPRDES